MKVYPIKLLADNYSYFVSLSASVGILVDPADHEAVIPALERIKCPLTHIFYTHRHKDHANPVSLEEIRRFNLRRSDSQLEVWSGKKDQIPGTTKSFDADSNCDVDSSSVRILQTPCHTIGSVCYLIESNDSPPNSTDVLASHNTSSFDCQKAVFTGDTIFIGGCGKFFEGNGEEMYRAIEKIRSLDDDVFLFCGHEYAKSNWNWAKGIDYENAAEYDSQIKRIHARGGCSIPSTIATEKKSNIFWKYHDASIMKKTGTSSPGETLNVLRKWKNENHKLV